VREVFDGVGFTFHVSGFKLMDEKIKEPKNQGHELWSALLVHCFSGRKPGDENGDWGEIAANRKPSSFANWPLERSGLFGSSLAFAMPLAGPGASNLDRSAAR